MGMTSSTTAFSPDLKMLLLVPLMPTLHPLYSSSALITLLVYSDAKNCGDIDPGDWPEAGLSSAVPSIPEDDPFGDCGAGCCRDCCCCGAGLHVRSTTFLVPPPVVVLIPVAACKEPLDWQFARRNMRRP